MPDSIPELPLMPPLTPQLTLPTAATHPPLVGLPVAPTSSVTDSATDTPFYFPQVGPLLPVMVIEPYRPRWWLHWLLFALTLLSALVVGARMQYEFNMGHGGLLPDDDSVLGPYPVVWAFSSVANLALGVPFALTLLFILFCHEMGHYLYCRHYRIDATPPFFIPFPSLIGTLGAFIKIRAPIETRQQLFDIGIGGPIAGFIPAVFFTFVGLAMSHVTYVTTSALAAADGSAQAMGIPLVFNLVHWVTGHGWGVEGVELHPVAIAAWVGMFATALNLLPAGQLDGGHIVFSLLPNWHRVTSVATIVGLVFLAWNFYTGWMLWAIVLTIMGARHPFVAPWPTPSRKRYILGAMALMMLVLTLIPAPIVGEALPQTWEKIRPELREFKQQVRRRIGW